jgi:hypothetical protein
MLKEAAWCLRAVVADFWSSWKKLESGMELFYPYSLIVKGLKCSCRCGL